MEELFENIFQYLASEDLHNLRQSGKMGRRVTDRFVEDDLRARGRIVGTENDQSAFIGHPMTPLLRRHMRRAFMDPPKWDQMIGDGAVLNGNCLTFPKDMLDMEEDVEECWRTSLVICDRVMSRGQFFVKIYGSLNATWTRVGIARHWKYGDEALERCGYPGWIYPFSRPDRESYRRLGLPNRPSMIDCAVVTGWPTPWKFYRGRTKVNQFTSTSGLEVRTMNERTYDRNFYPILVGDEPHLPAEEIVLELILGPRISQLRVHRPCAEPMVVATGLQGAYAWCGTSQVREESGLGPVLVISSPSESELETLRKSSEKLTASQMKTIEDETVVVD
jgi:hypothetical protein